VEQEERWLDCRRVGFNRRRMMLEKGETRRERDRGGRSYVIDGRTYRVTGSARGLVVAVTRNVILHRGRREGVRMGVAQSSMA